LIVQKIDSYKGPDSFLPWLDRLTINVVKMHFRKKALLLRRTSDSDLDTLNIYDNNTPENTKSNKQLYVRLMFHIKKLKPKYKTAVTLSMIEGYSAREIAEITGCSEDAAWKRIQRGFKTLQKRVDKDSDLKSILGKV
jgi:RNA polymerase sigma-70 factor (ECF subfamily)